jgi:hypothetical protein
MKKKLFIGLLGALLIGTVGFGGGAIAAPKLCDDGTRPPCEGGGGGGNEPPDFGDLIILHRDDFGVPILDGSQCQQPVAFPSDSCLVECIEGEPCLVPVDPLTCAVEIGYATCTEEVDFGRINLARATDTVLASQLEDVVVNLAIADCTTLDPAGRLVASRYLDEMTLLTTTIDSPLQNLAIYRQLMLTGDLGVPLPDGVDMLATAARGLGVALDKTGTGNVDLVAYVNHIMGLSDPDSQTVLEKTCIDVKEEVMGTVQLVEKCFLKYDVFGYERDANFGSLPAPAYIPEGTPTDGWFEYLAPVGNGGQIDPTFEIAEGPILNAVFPDGLGGYELGFMGGDIGGFAQAVDDTRAVIQFMHNWAVPAEYETAVPCDAAPGPGNYDLSISEESGLQVPVQMVANTEGREFTVSVANAGPQAASGSVVVTAVPAAGGPVLVEEDDGTWVEGPFVFEFTDLAAGMSSSTTEFFRIDEPYQRTTITWTATAEGEHDVNPSNNTVTATTNVRVTGGGGGGGGGGKGGSN